MSKTGEHHDSIDSVEVSDIGISINKSGVDARAGRMFGSGTVAIVAIVAICGMVCAVALTWVIASA